MDNTESRPLGSLSETAYEMLCEATDSADGIRFDDAIAQLCAADFAIDDAEYAVERLLNRGYLYQVDGELFVTEREDVYGNSENEK